jgi:5,5'-dehydrodivanillate O-demethylase oxygenase subunit
MLTAEENALLAQIGPGTPAGALLRRYWQPLCVAAELTAEQPVQRVTIMGEDLVVFRDRQGQYGCLAEHCAHRGVSLYYGFVEDCGIRCAYHGWKFRTTDGQCLEQPFEPAGSTYRDRVRQRAYPVQKLAGFLWVYMGPEPAPLLPRWDVLVREDGERRLEVRPIDCNWLQAMENTVDFTHTYYLHGHTMYLRGIQRGGVAYFYRPIERYGFKTFEWGIYKYWTYGGERGESAMGIPLIFPNILRVFEDRSLSMHWRVPIDDTHLRIMRVLFKPSPDGSRVEQPADPPAAHLGTFRAPDGEYDLCDFPAQDKMAWETQGPLYDRATEHLGASDRGIIMLRKMLREQIEIVARGGEPMALVRDPAQSVMIETLAERKGWPDDHGDGFTVIAEGVRNHPTVHWS